MDICQSILANFYLRAAAGRYDRNEPWQLVALLTKIAQNKLATQARSEYRQPRDVRRASRLSDAWPAQPTDARGRINSFLTATLDRAYERSWNRRSGKSQTAALTAPIGRTSPPNWLAPPSHFKSEMSRSHVDGRE
jgi:hypothetical protein